MNNATKRRIRKQMRRGLRDTLMRVGPNARPKVPNGAYMCGASLAREFLIRGRQPTAEDLDRLERVAMALLPGAAGRP